MRVWLRFVLRSYRRLIFGLPRFASYCERCGGDGRIAGGFCPVCMGQLWLRSEEQKARLKAWDRGELGFWVED